MLQKKTIQPPLIKFWNIPNVICVIRLFLSIGVVFCVLFHWKPAAPYLLWIAMTLFLIAAASDWLDGFLARKWNQITVIGKFLDPLIDKILINATLAALCFKLTTSKPEWFVYVVITVIILFIIRDVIVDYMRVAVFFSNHYLVVSANIWGKLKTVAQMITVLLVFFLVQFLDQNKNYNFYLLIINITMLSISLCLTWGSCVVYMKQVLAIIKQRKKQLSYIFQFCLKHKLTLSSCESVTGGLFASFITSQAGASQFYKGGFISYTPDIKTNLVGLPESFVINENIISAECAAFLATSALSKFKTDIGIGFTGNAGPTTMEVNVVGLSYISVVYQNQVTTEKYFLTGSRTEIQKQLAWAGIALLYKIIN